MNQLFEKVSDRRSRSRSALRVQESSNPKEMVLSEKQVAVLFKAREQDEQEKYLNKPVVCPTSAARGKGERSPKRAVQEYSHACMNEFKAKIDLGRRRLRKLEMEASPSSSLLATMPAALARPKTSAGLYSKRREA